MSDRNPETNTRGDQSLARASDRLRRCETPSSRSCSHRRDSRCSRSRARRHDETLRKRRDGSRSRHRSGSFRNEQSLRQLSQERERVRILEKEVRLRRERERLEELNRAYQRVTTPTPGPKQKIREPSPRITPNRSLVTPSKRPPNGDDSEPVLKRPGLTENFFEEFLNVLKSRAGDRESFHSSTLSNVIPEFNPMLKEQTINIWLDKVDECVEIYNWSDKQAIHYALPKLVGLAKTWYQGLPSIKHTWVEWKTMLRESFPATENYAELLTDMLNRRVRHGESYELYYFAKINMLNRCKIFGKQAVDCLLYGIDDSGVRVGAQAAKFVKPEDVLEFFKTIKMQNRNPIESLRDPNRDRRQNNMSTFTNSTLTNNTNTLKASKEF